MSDALDAARAISPRSVCVRHQVYHCPRGKDAVDCLDCASPGRLRSRPGRPCARVRPVRVVGTAAGSLRRRRRAGRLSPNWSASGQVGTIADQAGAARLACSARHPRSGPASELVALAHGRELRVFVWNHFPARPASWTPHRRAMPTPSRQNRPRCLYVFRTSRPGTARAGRLPRAQVPSRAPFSASLPQPVRTVGPRAEREPPRRVRPRLVSRD